MLRSLRLSFVLLVRSVRSRHNLLLENLALRQQLAVLKNRHPQPQFAAPDKLLWVVLRRFWPGWKQSLVLGQPETGFRGIGPAREENASANNCMNSSSAW